DVCCERVFAPDTDMAQVLRDKRLPLSTLESQRPLRDFDIIGFSLAYELVYTNVLAVLDLAGIPLEAASRDKGFPLVIAGGPAVINPEPVHEFFDLFIIGEAEEAAVELMDSYRALKQRYRSGSLAKHDLLLELSRIEGVYVPSLYDVSYASDGTVSSFAPNRPGVAATVKKRVFHGFGETSLPAEWLVPYIQIIHDRITVEVSRGCPNRCRFCQARSCYFPLRYRPAAKAIAAAKKYFRQTGYDEVALSGLSVSDYPDLSALMEQMVCEFKPYGVSVSLPSVKPKTFLGSMSGLIATVKKTGLTFAPEAATDRLRSVIGKDFDEEEFFRMLGQVYRAGYQHVKLYFMTGLPHETQEDIEAIAHFARRVSAARKEAAGASAGVNVSINTVVPKPHTPFQWLRMDSLERMEQTQRFLLSKVNSRKIRVSFHDRHMNFLEGVLSRGDRRLSAALKRAYAKGCIFDAWSEHFNFNAWMDALRETGCDPGVYVRQRGIDELLPWDFIDVGIPRSALEREFRAIGGGCFPDRGKGERQ
ncbi:MAG TPA: TIGR03960 family B12-binding radical SAM protein, partial [Candidatus Omnitrophota bacterium]|nr:TIGR03960 family B12-binding radical SAM protein [Candidatus Omnitrophota bacterium]